MNSIRQHIIIFRRFLARNKFYAIINILGLALGIACSLIILLYCQKELTYDQHHLLHENIYRAGSQFDIGNQEERYAISSHTLAPLLAKKFPEMAAIARLRSLPRTLLLHGEEGYYEEGLFFGDSSVFEIFTHNFIHGDSLTCLVQPRSIVLTESLSRKYFGEVNPVGKKLSTIRKEYTVTGVIEDLPDNSHLIFDGLISYSTFWENGVPNDKDLAKLLGSVSDFTFIRFSPDFGPEDLLDRFPDFLEAYSPPSWERNRIGYQLILEPLASIHYDSPLAFDLPKGNWAYLYAFGAIGLFILILACINYTNMATARSGARSREVGIKKALGIRRSSLVLQFLWESIILAGLALFIGLAMVELVFNLTPFNDLIGKELDLNFIENTSILWFALGITLLIGLLSGAYPAFYLSSIGPVQALKGDFRGRRTGRLLRRILVGVQFTVSVGVILCTLLIGNQIEFVREKDLGFDRENIVLIPVRDSSIRKDMADIKAELNHFPGVAGTTTSNEVPGGFMNRRSINVEADTGWVDYASDYMEVDLDYLLAMNMHLKEGRSFQPSDLLDTAGVFVVNQTMVNDLGWENPLGRRIEWGRDSSSQPMKKGKIIGVVEDFNVTSLHTPIDPLVMQLLPKPGYMLYVRLEEANAESTLEQLALYWKKHDPKRPFDYSFLDKDFDLLYQEDQRQHQLLNLLSFLCILISCLGLLGLASYIIEQRVKEIGVRKVLGASAFLIVLTLFKDFFYLISLSSLLASIVALRIFELWLENFAFHAGINWWLFILVAFGAVLITFLTVSFHAFRAAAANPVDSLKYE